MLVANGGGALVAIIGYTLLAPGFGVPGVLAAMVAGHLVRLAIFLKSGHELAPVRYPIGAAVAVFAIAAAAVAFAPQPTAITARALWSVLAVLCTCAAILALRLVVIPGGLLTLARRRMADVGIP